jgi:hypothetical protein
LLTQTPDNITPAAGDGQCSGRQLQESLLELMQQASCVLCAATHCFCLNTTWGCST